MVNQRGMQKIEFYTSLHEIKELYSSGYVVLKILYEEMKKRRGWEMSYWSFCKYAKEELPLKKTVKYVVEKETPKVETHDDSPVIARADFGGGARFNPHTAGIDPSRIL
ncbi:MAG: hypothetical protein HF962_01645 [Sulfurovum sp.]|nr:hypothetical protein [Sulfurovum sp.]